MPYPTIIIQFPTVFFQRILPVTHMAYNSIGKSEDDAGYPSMLCLCFLRVDRWLGVGPPCCYAQFSTI